MAFCLGGKTMKVSFYQQIDDEKLKFAVIAVRYQNKWVFCKHKLRNTYEIPGGHREPGESVEACAKRELYEETGALDYTIERILDYGVEDDGQTSYGSLFYGQIKQLGKLPESEIGSVHLFDQLPDSWTYPEIQPLMIAELKRRQIK